jgi:hypothetical protein
MPMTNVSRKQRFGLLPYSPRYGSSMYPTASVTTYATKTTTRTAKALNSDADLGLDNSTEAQYPDAPAHKDGKWRWWTREQPRDGERVEAYGFEFTTKHRSVTPLSFKGVVIQHMDDDDKIASGIASHNGHGALLHDPNIHIEIVCWKPQTRVGRPSTKAK